MQMVELLYRSPPQFDREAIRRRAAQLLGEVRDLPGKPGDKALIFVHPAHVTHLKDGQMPAQTAILEATPGVTEERYAEELQQSWSCEDARELIAQAQHTHLVTELMARWQQPGDRARLFHGVLQATVEITLPDALVFLHTQQVLAASTYLEDCDREPILRRGSLNVRFFTISGSGGDMIMDTRGMHELGLHDLQCHFRNLDPNKVAGKLRDTAAYLFENGPVIKSGETVEGLSPEEKWRCQLEKSLLEPKREILDLNPGSPNAAGNR